MRKIFNIILVTLLTFSASTTVMAQDYTNPKYLKGMVPEENGFVVFRQSYECPGRSQAEIYDALSDYTKGLVAAKISLQQSRITQLTPEDGTIAASMEETLTFKSTNWVLDTARFFYQVVFTVREGGFDAMIRRIHYLYEVTDVPGIDTTYSAEDWITDRAALSRSGKLTRISGKKFRRCTIDRKDAIFEGAYQAAQGKK